MDKKPIWIDNRTHYQIKMFCVKNHISLKQFIEYSLNQENFKVVKVLAENGVSVKEDQAERE